MTSHSIDTYMADYCTALATPARGGRASCRWRRGTGRGGCRASRGRRAGRGRRAIIGARYANSRIHRRNRAIDATNCATLI